MKFVKLPVKNTILNNNFFANESQKSTQLPWAIQPELYDF